MRSFVYVVFIVRDRARDDYESVACHVVADRALTAIDEFRRALRDVCAIRAYQEDETTCDPDRWERDRWTWDGARPTSRPRGKPPQSAGARRVVAERSEKP